ncbi:MAG: hypothetical protein KDB22_12230 [Planctomycetales bacterium]|nr:hypothetical protein [Planctomycetales bacterium]
MYNRRIAWVRYTWLLLAVAGLMTGMWYPAVGKNGSPLNGATVAARYHLRGRTSGFFERASRPTPGHAKTRRDTWYRRGA